MLENIAMYLVCYFKARSVCILAVSLRRQKIVETHLTAPAIQ
jgi:hypothetical protein